MSSLTKKKEFYKNEKKIKIKMGSFKIYKYIYKMSFKLKNDKF